MSDTVSWRPKAGEIPTSPGVYRFRDGRGRVLYVGKAKNLRARLSNYFQPLRSLHERTRRMVTTAAQVEWTVVGSELEALQLEYSWIKEFAPPFNVKFRDDKSYPYLAITLGDEVPRVLITRNRKLRGAKYYGPYTKVWAIRETLDLMLKVFPVRSCSETTYKRAEATGRPCLLGDIGKCAAPCVGRVPLPVHHAMAEDLASFMAGGDQRFRSDLTKRMREAAEAQNYEAAAKYRDALGALEAAVSKSAVVLNEDVDTDVFGVAEDELAASVQQFLVRGGRIRGTRSWVVDKELDVSRGELIETVLLGAYEDDAYPPREVLVPELPDDVTELEALLTERRTAGREAQGLRGAGRVRLHVAERGDKAALAETAARNAAQALMLYKTRRSADFTARSQALADLQDALGLDDAPLRIECFDVSHLGGTNIVASMVVFEDGLPRKDQYRRFNVASSTDDTDSMYQVLRRRLAHLEDEDAAPAQQGDRFAYRPNLLVVDGGQPQVAAAARAFADAGVTGIAICGLAKRLEEIWLPGSDFPVILPRNSDALFLLQRLRDEAHRFAITHQRSRRKRDIGSQLGEIPGLGDARVKVLLKHFGSVAKLRQATLEQIEEVPGFGAVLAAAVLDRLRAPQQADEAADDPGGAATAARVDGDAVLAQDDDAGGGLPLDQGEPAVAR
ncbi:excinuclease ABC subunit UvrC [Amnibacterium sp. CER49]|uniref:excinuclease ABC subunit UvrC n=1 Tax=Amnibacterium sp. CER49 TaxID=3039161 RepID=UPI002447F951|nr:excinuclease ABC subunit UvrC [Amnibacterium sp. CER49]MDH2444407.1 excinuclease ABC subunit UvrC [Amnibacterium sp. CER49]